MTDMPRESLDGSAARLARQLARGIADDTLLTAEQLAARLHTQRSWVYAHATELGAIRLGTGPRPRLRFDPLTVAEHLRRPHTVGAPTARRPPAPHVELLPINTPTTPHPRRTVR